MEHLLSYGAPSFAAALLATLLLTPIVRYVARAFRLVARPSKDRWHESPTALMGGVAIFGGVLVGGAVLVALADLGPRLVANQLGMSGVGVMLASTLMFVTGLVDDKLTLKPNTKLICQGVAAATLVSFGVVYPLTPWVVVNILVTMFWFLALTNALNLLDNMDGVAVGVTGIAAAFLATTFAWEGAFLLSGVCLVICGATLGFLPYNFHRASIFMGDSGSLFLGSLLAGLGAAYPTHAGGSIVSVLFVPAFIVIIPILDTSLVTITRVLAGRPISMGGRDHTSHRLVAMGLSEPRAACLLYAFAVCGGAVGLVLLKTELAFGLWAGALFLIGLSIFAAYLGRLHSYTEEQVRSGRRFTVMISDLLYKRRALEVVLDLLLFAIAYQGAYLLRFDGTVPPGQTRLFEETLATVVAAKSVAFGAMRVYRGVWHQTSVSDVHRILKAVGFGSLLAVAAVVMLFRSAEFSRSVFILDAILVAVLAVGARSSFRSLDRLRRRLDRRGTPALIYGAGAGGELLLRELGANPQWGIRPVGLVDDDGNKHGCFVCGCPVLGDGSAIEGAVAKTEAEMVLVSTRKLPPGRLDALRDQCSRVGVGVFQMTLELRPLDRQGEGWATRREPIVSGPATTSAA